MQDDDNDTQFLISRFFAQIAIFNPLSYRIALHILPTVIWHLLQLYEISFYTIAAAIPILWALLFLLLFLH